MPALNVRLNDDELAALQRRSDQEGRSMQAIAHDAIVRSISERQALFEEAASKVLRASEELNRRLA